MTGNGQTASAGNRWRLAPIAGWIRAYDRGWLRGDLIAGVAVAALIVPKNLGYAGIAGIPLQNGLYGCLCDLGHHRPRPGGCRLTAAPARQGLA
jgi:hypothetical protein